MLEGHIKALRLPRFGGGGIASAAFKAFELGDNPGFRSWFFGWAVILKKLRARTRFSIDLGASSFVDTDGTTPVSLPWGVSGNLLIECKRLTFSATDSNDTKIEATLDGRSVSPSRWYTNDGGANWNAQNQAAFERAAPGAKRTINSVRLTASSSAE